MMTSKTYISMRGKQDAKASPPSVPQAKKYWILNEVKTEEKSAAEACYIDPNTGQKSCE